jgi:hypothetical protein
MLLFSEVTSQSDGISAPEFSIDDVQNMPCVLFKINATIIIEPKRTANKKLSVEVPRSAEAKGKCGNGQEAQIVIFWNSFQFMWHFKKARVSDAWFVAAIQLTYNTSDKAFEGKGGFDDTLPGGIQMARSPDPFTLWLTPIGESYSCSVTQEVKIMDAKKQGRVTIVLRRIQIQPFAEMTRRQFGDAFMCKDEVGSRNETIPFAVGSLLAIVVLLTVLGYAGYRYMKVKKIEYDTME